MTKTVLSTFSLCLFFLVSMFQASDSCCHGYKIRKEEGKPHVEIVNRGDHDVTYSFSEDFAFEMDEKCHFWIKGCVDVPEFEDLEINFTMTHDTKEEPIHGRADCDTMDEHSGDPRLGCFIQMLGSDSCPFSQKKICNYFCPMTGVVPKYMEMAKGKSYAHLRIRTDQLFTEVDINMEIEKC